MSADLDEAFRAVREQTAEPRNSGMATRRAMLAQVQARERNRARLVSVFVPLAALLVISVAWAAASGRLTRRVMPSSVPGVAAPSAHNDQASALPDPLRPLPSSSASLPIAPLSSVENRASTAARNAPLTTGAPPEHLAVPPAAASRSSAELRVSPREQALYETAHQAHFAARAPAAALPAWDAYLAEFPDGRFALEARYNRAICLVRLGRHDAARAALQPFANGEAGGYRQQDAIALLDALRTADAGAAP
jgi:TolA-binding protein